MREAEVATAGTFGVDRAIGALLGEACRSGGLSRALVCTHEGLLVATAGDGDTEIQEYLAALTALFADIVVRVGRDLAMHAVDEVTLLDAVRGRVVIRPLGARAEVAMFLVVELPKPQSWRRTTNALVVDVHRVLDQSYQTGGSADAAPLRDAHGGSRS